jgi:hypothetical protein
MLALGIQPPCCDEAQTNPSRKRTERGPHGNLRLSVHSQDLAMSMTVNKLADYSSRQPSDLPAETPGIMEKRKVNLTVPCSNSRPVESVSIINDCCI